MGVELYFDDPGRAKDFYAGVFGLRIAEEKSGQFSKLDCCAAFLCLESKGTYASRDKAVLFFEVDDLAAKVRDLGQERFVQVEAGWAVMHDPEGHNVLLLQRGAIRG